MRDAAQAVQLAKRCCDLTGYDRPPTLDTLAAAYAESNQFDEAIQWLNKAIKLTPLADQAELKKRLELSKASKPYRESR